MRSYQTLDVWKASLQLVKEICWERSDFLKEELLGLTAQAKRAAFSIPANIAEGVGRQYKQGTLQFLYIDGGSVYEPETHLRIAAIMDCTPKHSFARLLPLPDNVCRLLNGLVSNTEKANPK